MYDLLFGAVFNRKRPEREIKTFKVQMSVRHSNSEYYAYDMGLLEEGELEVLKKVLFRLNDSLRMARNGTQVGMEAINIRSER